MIRRLIDGARSALARIAVGAIFSTGIASILTIGAIGAGCAAPRAELTPDMLERMQREARIEIYDRENDVVIARNRETEARLHIEAIRREMKLRAERNQRIQTRLAKSGGDSSSRIDKTFSSRRAYLDAQEKDGAAQLAIAEQSVQTAEARLQQTRQRQLVRTGRALAASMVPFDKQVELLEKREHELERREQDQRAEVEKAFEGWKSAEDDFFKSTGDYDTGIWID